MNNFRFKYDMLHMSTETNHITKSLVEWLACLPWVQ